MTTLDGVIQSPGGPKEDTSGGFRYGGWVAQHWDEMYDKAVQQELKVAADFLLGRKTYEIWADYWPHHGEFWPRINEGAKYVFSKKLKKNDPLITGWNNASVISSVAALKQLKASDGADIQVWGSSELVPLLLKQDLVDELRLKIHPILLGTGKKLFGEGTTPAAFTLAESIITPKGVIIAAYKRVGDVKPGSMGV